MIPGRPRCTLFPTRRSSDLTVEIAVPLEKADGGIILTASHNPKQWNALKLLNEKGEFLDAAQGAKILGIAEEEDRKSTRLNSSHVKISYAVFCLKKKTRTKK